VWEFEATPLLTAAEAAQAAAWAQSSGVAAEMVRVTGAVQPG
jgi:hypothetical protein